MTELDPAALDAAEHRGQYLLPRELLAFVERFDEDADRGVTIDRLAAYADALDERGVQSVDASQMDEAVEADLTDVESWTDPDAIYRVDGSVSAFPARWHDELAGEDDLLTFVDVIESDLASGEKHTASGATGEGVPEPLLLDTASALGSLSRDGAKAEIARLREEGLLAEGADQNPNARVRRRE